LDADRQRANGDQASDRIKEGDSAQLMVTKSCPPDSHVIEPADVWHRDESTSAFSTVRRA